MTRDGTTTSSTEPKTPSSSSWKTLMMSRAEIWSRSYLTSTERTPGHSSRTHGSSRSSSINTWTRMRYARSSSISPYSVSTCSSPDIRYVTLVSALSPAAGSSIAATAGRSTASAADAHPGVHPSAASSSSPATSAMRTASDALTVALVAARDVSQSTCLNRSVVPGRACATFHSSTVDTLTGHANSPSAGPSIINTIGVFPEKFTAPGAYV
jgi:hypothetical protein